MQQPWEQSVWWQRPLCVGAGSLVRLLASLPPTPSVWNVMTICYWCTSIFSIQSGYPQDRFYVPSVKGCFTSSSWVTFLTPTRLLSYWTSKRIKAQQLFYSQIPQSHGGVKLLHAQRTGVRQSTTQWSEWPKGRKCAIWCSLNTMSVISR